MTWLRVDLNASQNGLENNCTEPGRGDLPIVRQFYGCAKGQYDKPGLCAGNSAVYLFFYFARAAWQNGDMNAGSYPFVIGRATQSQSSAV